MLSVFPNCLMLYIGLYMVNVKCTNFLITNFNCTVVLLYITVEIILPINMLLDVHRNFVYCLCDYNLKITEA